MITAGMLLASPALADLPIFTWMLVADQFGEAQSVYAVDLDGDTDVDVLGASAGNDEIAWWENDGSQQFSKRSVDTGFSEPQSVYSADVNGDGDVDILGASAQRDEIPLWENSGAGTTAIELASFSARAAEVSSALPGSPLVWLPSLVALLWALAGVAQPVRRRGTLMS